MDKKNTIIGVALLIAAFAVMLYWPRSAPAPQAPPPPAAAPSTTAAPTAAPESIAAPAVVATTAPLDPAQQQIVTLANEKVRVAFTDHGGAIRDVEFLTYPAVRGQPEPYVFNDVRFAPMLAFVGRPGLDAGTRWQLVEQSAARVVYRTVVDGRLEVTRTFALPQTPAEGDLYRLIISTTLRNVSTEPIGAQRVAINLGTAAPIGRDDPGQFVNVGTWDGDAATFVGRSELEASSGFLWTGMGAHDARPTIEHTGRVVWASTKNQFFTSILTLDQPGVGSVVRRVKVFGDMPDSAAGAYGITGDVQVDLPRLEAGATASLGAKFYVGPKEYARLKAFEQREQDVMQFSNGFTKIFLAGIFAPLLLIVLDWFHSFLGNWGWAIVVTTIALKVITLPLTLSAARSAKRMAKIQPRLKEINEKYADNPQRKQKETLELFKEAKVNPLGGCLPILITMPFFFGFFAMLQTSSELRFAEFLWVTDLASPDTVARLPFLGFNIPINIMPLLMGITSIIQMQLVPTPSVDNAQARMLKFMPYVFVLFCYNFGSGLALYWTVSNVFTIVQQIIINRMPDPAVDLPTGGEGMKNVTPPGRKSRRK